MLFIILKSCTPKPISITAVSLNRYYSAQVSTRIQVHSLLLHSYNQMGRLNVTTAIRDDWKY